MVHKCTTHGKKKNTLFYQIVTVTEEIIAAAANKDDLAVIRDYDGQS